jgi:hypothetical protein
MNLLVRDDAYLAGRDGDPNGVGELPFVADDVVAIRRHAALGALSPFCS